MLHQELALPAETDTCQSAWHEQHSMVPSQLLSSSDMIVEIMAGALGNAYFIYSGPSAIYFGPLTLIYAPPRTSPFKLSSSWWTPVGCHVAIRSARACRPLGH